MPGYANPGFDTLALHAGAAPDPATGARAVPLHLTTSFVFESSEHAAALFNLERPGHVYTRISNPTNAMLAGNDHIFTAMGRDFADVSPLDGVFIGGSGQRMKVSVEVTPLDL